MKRIVLLARSLTVAKLFNLLVLSISYRLSVWSGRPMHRGAPAFLSLEPVNWCNLRCPECPVGTQTLRRAHERLAPAVAEKLLEELKRSLIAVQFFFQGEPFLHSALSQLIAFASQRRIYTIVSTNGHYLSADTISALLTSGLDELIVSLDGADAQTYTAYRKGGDFQKVVGGIKDLCAAKRKAGSSKPLVVIQCLVNRHNHHQIGRMKTLSRELGADRLELKSMQVYAQEQVADWIPPVKHFARYRLEAGRWRIKSRLKNRCWRIWASLVVSSSGTVAACCFDKDADYSPGEFGPQTALEIWHGKKMNAFRKAVWTSRRAIAMCQNCTEGMRV